MDRAHGASEWLQGKLIARVCTAVRHLFHLQRNYTECVLVILCAGRYKVLVRVYIREKRGDSRWSGQGLVTIQVRECVNMGASTSKVSKRESLYLIQSSLLMMVVWLGSLGGSMACRR